MEFGRINTMCLVELVLDLKGKGMKKVAVAALVVGLFSGAMFAQSFKDLLVRENLVVQGTLTSKGSSVFENQVIAEKNLHVNGGILTKDKVFTEDIFEVGSLEGNGKKSFVRVGRKDDISGFTVISPNGRAELSFTAKNNGETFIISKVDGKAKKMPIQSAE